MYIIPSVKYISRLNIDRGILLKYNICKNEGGFFMERNIILIGMPGSGKSTCGVLAAKALCMSFTDTDLLIQSAEEMKLQDIINERGTEYFEKAEERALLGVDCESTIISTGGSAVYYDNAMKKLKENGKVIYLKVDYDEMIRRISNMKTRGILLKEGETMEQLFRSRESLYEKYADVTIDCSGHTVEDTVLMICRAAAE